MKYHSETSASYGSVDPIFALATPLAESALALIRVSGSPGGNEPGAIQLLAKVFSKPVKILNATSGSVVHGWIINSVPAESGAGSNKENSKEHSKIDEVLVSLYRAPKSYTGEDGADISCHGGIAVVKAVMEVLRKAGFREALPGEFTFRAFMNGKLDLTRAESVMELVAAKTHKGREQALRRLAGVLETEISAIRDLLVEVLTGTEIYLDYSEDEFLGSSSDEEKGRLPERKLAVEAAGRLKKLAELWQRERIYSEGALAVIAGRPNAGKSSLFNYLVHEDRSIVTDLPGTTRDWIDALISIEGIPLRLADTAGLKKLDLNKSDASEKDNAEEIGIKRSIELLEKADLVLYVIDGLMGFTAEDGDFIRDCKIANPEKRMLLIWNKSDLARPQPPAMPTSDGLPESAPTPPPLTIDGLALQLPASNGQPEPPPKLQPPAMPTSDGLPESAPTPPPTYGRSPSAFEAPRPPTPSTPAPFLAISSKTGEGIPELIRSLADILGAASGPVEAAGQNATGPGSIRQKELIDSALASVEEALDLADREEPLDLIAPLFRSALNALGEITGEVTNAEILEKMFSRFCVGK